MKRFIKYSLNILLAVIAAFLTLVIVFFLTPPWQKWFLESVLEQDPGRQWQVGAVRIQPFSVDLSEVFVMDGNIGAGARHVHASGPFWKLPILGRLEVDNGTISGLDMDLSQLRVGDQTSEDYQAFLARLSSDSDLWEERIGLLVSKAAAQGIEVSLRDLVINGTLFMPGERIIPVNWKVVQADSDSLDQIEVEPSELTGKEL